MTARERIAAAAAANGWEKDAKESTRLTDYWRKGGRWLRAFFSEEGVVISATRRTATGVIRGIHGQSKVNKIITELEA